MRISEIVIRPIADFVCGDSKVTPYLSGPTLVELFRKHGFDDSYEAGFPSRWAYTKEKVGALNGTTRLQKLLEDIIDPRRFVGTDKDLSKAISALSELLKYDGLILVKDGNTYRIVGMAGVVVESSISKEINHDFINEQISKSKKKIDEGDYNGAITNARSLIEAVCIELIVRIEGVDVKNDGSIDKLWSRTKKAMRLEMNKETLPDTVNQILSGLDTAVNGLAGLSNNASDRHATNFKTQKHHAKLAVNLSLALTDFLFESLEYQRRLNKATIVID